MNTALANPARMIEDGDLLYLSPLQIEEQPGFNPRSYYDPQTQKELDESIAAEGVQQNLVVRPQAGRPDAYWVIAGHRRLRSAKQARLEEVPCLIRLVDDRQALAIATLENDKRDNISPAEEALQARRMLDACNGDRDEATRLLGWSRSRLDARLLLLHADESVLTALAERKVKLGIAELLSTLPKPAQAKNLPAIVEKGYSVAEVKVRIEGMAQMLSAAIFDTTGCNGCPHNSSTQATLFPDALGEGQCTGRACHAEKTKAALDTKKSQIAEQYNCVFLDIEKEPGTWAFLIREGKQGVGPEQFDACKGCAHFGAIISSEPGCEGQVREEVCFDLACNTKMVAAHAATLGTPQTDVQGTPQKGNQAGKTQTKKKTTAKNKSVNAVPKKVTDYVDGFLREQASEIASRDPATIRAVTLHALLDAAGMLDRLGKKGRSRAEAIRILHGMDDTALDALELAAVQHQLHEQKGRFGDGEEFVKAAIQVVVSTQTDLTGRFTLTKAFLEAHTKSGIEALMREAADPEGRTFVDWYESQEGKPSFKKLVSRTMGELIEAIMESGFDFTRWVPKCVTKAIADVARSNP